MRSGPIRVLVVDDEPGICWALDRILREAGCVVVTAASGREALNRLAGETYDVAFLDAKLRDIEGAELAGWILEHSPGTVRILVSGYFYGEDEGVVAAINRHLFSAFLPKPFAIEDVRRILRQAVTRTS